jgi:ribosomal protein L11 methyltransferase
MQKEQLWQIEFPLNKKYIDSFMEGLDEHADSMTCFENKSEDDWVLVIYTQTEPNQTLLNNDIKSISDDLKIDSPKPKIAELEIKDWVSESQKNFEAVEADNIFVYPSWRKDEIPTGKMGIEIDPGQAFGTGGHETTKGCLLALQKLKDNSFENILDMGCGSGLLGIAGAKIWGGSKVLLVDNDPICIDVTNENIKINSVDESCKSYISDGYNSDIVQENSPYDLIISNILASPLIEFSGRAYEALADAGYIILAGLREEQAQSVIDAHTQKNFKLVENNILGEWSILILVKE